MPAGIGGATREFELVVFLDSDYGRSGLPLQLPARLRHPTVGAASGLVEDTPPRNIWELSSAARTGSACRSISRSAPQTCASVELLLGHEMEEDFNDNAVTSDGVVDTSFSGRCDEEGLYLAIRRAGWRVVAHPDSKVDHDHPYDRRSLCKQAFHGGGAAPNWSGSSGCVIVWTCCL